MDPYDLHLGIRLFDSGDLLPWDAPLDDLKSIGQPNVEEYESRTTLTWFTHTVLGDIQARVSCVFYDNKGWEERPHNNVGGLRMVRFDMRGRDDEDWMQLYHRLRNKLLPDSFCAIETKVFDLFPCTDIFFNSAMIALLTEEYRGWTEIWAEPVPAWRRKDG